jgi:predicted HTH transcriptional regulator
MATTNLTPKEKSIIVAIHKKSGQMSPYEIMKETRFSYATVRKYLRLLLRKKILIKRISGKPLKKQKGKRGKIARYSLNYNKIHGKK